MTHYSPHAYDYQLAGELIGWGVLITLGFVALTELICRASDAYRNRGRK